MVENFGPQLAYFSRSPGQTSKNGHDSKVPIMMYHDILPQKKYFLMSLPRSSRNIYGWFKRVVLPISLNQLTTHLSTGLPYQKSQFVNLWRWLRRSLRVCLPITKKSRYPGVFQYIQIGQNTGRSHVTWDQLQKMAADPLITIAAHSLPIHRIWERCQIRWR